jgi:hypothetical protein
MLQLGEQAPRVFALPEKSRMCQRASFCLPGANERLVKTVAHRWLICIDALPCRQGFEHASQHRIPQLAPADKVISRANGITIDPSLAIRSEPSPR